MVPKRPGLQAVDIERLHRCCVACAEYGILILGQIVPAEIDCDRFDLKGDLLDVCTIHPKAELHGDVTGDCLVVLHHVRTHLDRDPESALAPRDQSGGGRHLPYKGGVDEGQQSATAHQLGPKCGGVSAGARSGLPV